MFSVLVFQLFCGFDIFQNKEVRRKTIAFHPRFILVTVPLALPGSPGLLSWFFHPFPLLLWHSCLFPFLLGISILGELFFSGLGSFHDYLSGGLPRLFQQQVRADVQWCLHFGFDSVLCAPSRFAKEPSALRREVFILRNTIKAVCGIINLALSEP